MMYTMKITLFYIDENLLLSVGGRCHKEGKIGMISFETTNKEIFIHVFLTSVAQEKLKK